MPFDGIVISNITHDLNKYLSGGRIEKIYQPGPLELLFNVHSDRKNYKLLISAESISPRIHLTTSASSNQESPLSFCMLLRKHIQNGKILSVNQVGSERVVEIIIESKNEMGFTDNKKLTIEIMGKHSNIVLVAPDTNRIIDSIKRIHEDINRFRQTLPGFQYVYPPSKSKISFFEITKNEFLGLFRDFDTNVSSFNSNELAMCLVDGIQGISPIIAREICSAGADFNNCWDVFSSLIESIKNTNFKPVAYYSDSNSIKDFYSFPIKTLSEKYIQVYKDDICSICEDFYKIKDKSNFNNSKVLEIEKILTAAKNKLVKKIVKLNQDMEKAEIDINGKIYGELLMANLYNIKQGDESAVVENYYTGATLTIQLDTKLTPSKNAQIYFKKYSKSKRAKQEKLLQIADSENEILYIDSVLSHLSNSSSIADIEETKLELMETGYLKTPKIYAKVKKLKFEPIVYTSQDGFKIMVGKNNKENDNLTFKIASRNDIWLHTKDIPGSHVILFADGKQIDAETIEFAAKIAAYHSKAKLSGNVPVDYTLVKNIKKPAGAKPGMVIFINNKTIFVNPSIPSDSL